MKENNFYNIKCLLMATRDLEAGKISRESTETLIKLHYQLIMEASKVHG